MNDAEKQELEQVAPEPDEATESGKPDSIEPGPAKPILSVWSLVLALLAVFGTVGGLTAGYQKWTELQNTLQRRDQTIQEFSTRLEDMQQQRETSDRTITDQQAAFAAQDSRLQEERARLEQQSAEMKAALEGVFQHTGRTSTQWVVAEAEYLMRIANHRLQLEGDVATTLTALEIADDRLRDTGDPAWTGVREQLAAEKESLRVLVQVDLAGYALKLSGLAAQVENLRLPVSGPVVGVAAPAEAEAEGRTVKTMLKDGWEGFKSLMVIRRNDRPATAMLAPEQRFFLSRNLHLQLETARFALLRKDQVLYDSSLEQAGAWLVEFFDQAQSVTKSMLTGIAELKGVRVRSALPDISGSLRSLLEQRRFSEEKAKAGT